jgi:Ca2+-binding EF-hand superfamily protein
MCSGKISVEELRRVLTQLGRMRLSDEEADTLIGELGGVYYQMIRQTS